MNTWIFPVFCLKFLSLNSPKKPLLPKADFFNTSRRSRYLRITLSDSTSLIIKTNKQIVTFPELFYSQSCHQEHGSTEECHMNCWALRCFFTGAVLVGQRWIFSGAEIDHRLWNCKFAWIFSWVLVDIYIYLPQRPGVILRTQKHPVANCRFKLTRNHWSGSHLGILREAGNMRASSHGSCAPKSYCPTIWKPGQTWQIFGENRPWKTQTAPWTLFFFKMWVFPKIGVPPNHPF